MHARAEGCAGLGHGHTDGAAAALVRTRLAELFAGGDAGEVERGWLCDLKTRLLGAPLVSLGGAGRAGLEFHGSGGFTSDSDEQLQPQLGSWAVAGFPVVKMKGGCDVRADRRRVALARRWRPRPRSFICCESARRTTWRPP